MPLIGQRRRGSAVRNVSRSSSATSSISAPNGGSRWPIVGWASASSTRWGTGLRAGAEQQAVGDAAHGASTSGEVLGRGARAGRRGSSARSSCVATRKRASSSFCAVGRHAADDPSARRGARRGTRPRGARRPRVAADVAVQHVGVARAASAASSTPRSDEHARRRRRGTSVVGARELVGFARWRLRACPSAQLVARPPLELRARTSPVSAFAWPGQHGGGLERGELADRRARLLGVEVERRVRHARVAVAARLRVERVEAVAGQREAVATRGRARSARARGRGGGRRWKPATSSPSLDRAGDLHRAAVPDAAGAAEQRTGRAAPSLREVEVVRSRRRPRRRRPRRGGSRTGTPSAGRGAAVVGVRRGRARPREAAERAPRPPRPRRSSARRRRRTSGRRRRRATR